jgi:hypothetical protein
MKKMVTFLLCLILSGTTFSQMSYPPIATPMPFATNIQDTILQRRKMESQNNKMPYTGMPNSLTNTLPPVYKGNNNRGFDLYESPLDQMPILIPDSTNVYKMPNKILKLTEKNEGAASTYHIPSFIIDEIEERRKWRDSLFMKKVKPKSFVFPKK